MKRYTGYSNWRGGYRGPYTYRGTWNSGQTRDSRNSNERYRPWPTGKDEEDLENPPDYIVEKKTVESVDPGKAESGEKESKASVLDSKTLSQELEKAVPSLKLLNETQNRILDIVGESKDTISDILLSLDELNDNLESSGIMERLEPVNPQDSSSNSQTPTLKITRSGGMTTRDNSMWSGMNLMVRPTSDSHYDGLIAGLVLSKSKEDRLHWCSQLLRYLRFGIRPRTTPTNSVSGDEGSAGEKSESLKETKD